MINSFGTQILIIIDVFTHFFIKKGQINRKSYYIILFISFYI